MLGETRHSCCAGGRAGPHNGHSVNQRRENPAYRSYRHRLYTWFWPTQGRDRFREMHTMIVDSDGNLYGSDNQIGRTQKLVPRKDADPKLLIAR